MIDTISWWAGLLHLGLYAAAGTLTFSWWLVDVIADRLKFKRELVRALAQYHRNRGCDP